MHEVPLNSGFLASKFIKLSQNIDTHLLIWGSKDDVRKFLEQYKLPKEYKKRIHNVNVNAIGAIKAICLLIEVLFTSKAFRSYLWTSKGSFIEKLKFAVTYFPAIKYKWDIIHFEFGTIAQRATRLKEIVSAKLSVSFRGYDLNYAGLNDESYYGKVWDEFDGFHFLGNDLKQRAISRGYKGAKNEVLIPPAIDTEYFTAQPFEKETNIFVITSVGRLVWKKAYEYAIQAMTILKNSGVIFQYNIIGDGDARQQLEYLINEMGLNNEIKLLGSMSTASVKDELNRSNLFLHPAVSEGFSNAVLEAQAMGLPVICTDADGLSENIVDTVTGFIVPKWNAAAIAEKLIWCNNNKDRLNEMGNAGVIRARTYFQIEDQIEEFINYYRRLAIEQD